MVAVVVILICLVGFMVVKSLEYYKKQSYIAKIVDGEDISSNFIREEVHNVIAMIKDVKKNIIQRHVHNIALPDGQQISYFVDDMIDFKKSSALKFDPTDTEWEVLRLIVKKAYNLK
jgi:hypothetical protein